MIDFLHELFNSANLAPHGLCLLWRPELIWMHVLSDALIGTAYYSIPAAITYFVSRRSDIAFGWVFWAFAVFRRFHLVFENLSVFHFTHVPNCSQIVFAGAFPGIVYALLT